MRIRFPDRKTPADSKEPTEPAQSKWLARIAWAAAILMTLLMVFTIYQYISGNSILKLFQAGTLASANSQSAANLPEFTGASNFQSVKRDANLDTILPAGSRKNIFEYTVEKGDSIFGIAENFDVEPESVLWSNYDVLKDDPHLISAGTKLRIPPVDGVLYQWTEVDTLEKIAGTYHVDSEDIILFPGNNLDMTNPVIEDGTYIMVPDGYRAFQQSWVVPVIPSGQAGVTVKINGPGACVPIVTGPVGSLSFIWPTPHRSISGNDYWSGHQALDMTAYMGDSIYASDSGVVIYSGWIDGGYGYMIAIDHMNGYVTLYAHLSSLNVQCGQGVNRGTVIGFAGSSGNSTGPHLHFEVRLNGGFVNPWHVLQ
ncbi:MAG TPA: peptidoglycan DD-metalloendopeptidase family protein [Anaerolineae bacterium]|nr:peptidoglycan DD-metalloendopeptidase family protein [Anaerolineae bacterium]